MSVCLEIAKKIELDKYILTFNLRNKKNLIEDKVLSDSREALIGSIYLDQGFQVVEKVILNLWSDQIKNSIVTHIDAKTKLQEFSLKKFKERLDPRKYNGAIFLGLNGPVVKSHGGIDDVGLHHQYHRDF